MVRAVQLYVNDAGECDPAASMGSTGMKCGDSTEISWGRIDQWIGFVGKIYTGNPWVLTIKYSDRGFL